MDEKEEKLIKWVWGRIKEVYIIPIITLIKFWKWDKKTLREIVGLTLLVLIVAFFFFYKGMEYECIRQTGGGLAFKSDKDYGWFGMFKPDCVGEIEFYDLDKEDGSNFTISDDFIIPQKEGG